MTGLPVELVEIEWTAGVWTDVSSYVDANTPLKTQKGRSGAADDAQPGTLQLTLNNDDGRFTPDNPLGAYFPNVVDGKRIRVSAAGVNTFSGWVSSFVPTFVDGWNVDASQVAVSAVDALGFLALAPMRSALWHASKAHSPAMLYALDETNGNTGASDTSGNSGPLLTIRRVGLEGTCDFASTSGGLEDGAVVKFEASDTFGYAHLGSSSETPDLRLFGSASVRVKPTGAHLAAYIGYHQYAPTFIRYVAITVNASGLPQATCYDSGTGSNGSAVGTVALPTDRWSSLIATLDAGTLTLYVDGVSVATGATSCLPTLGRTFIGGTGAGGEYLGGTPTTPAYGDGQVADVAVWTSVLSAPAIAELAAAGDSDATSTLADRVTAIAAGAGLTATPTETGTRALGAQPWSGRNAFDLVTEAVRGERAFVFASGFELDVRADTLRSATATLTLDAEADLQGTPTWERSWDRRAASVTVSSYTAGSATALDSTATTGDEATLSTCLADSLDVLELAQAVLAEGIYRTLRITQVTVDLVTAATVSAAAVLALKLGDRVRVGGLPSALLGFSYQEGYVTGIAHEATASGYLVTLDLEPADAPVEGRWDDATDGRFGTDGVTTVGVLTSSGTTVVITSAGTPFTTAAASYPLDVDINGERVTLTSAPASSTSPQTFTGVTRGVAPTVARAHSAGEPVDVWHAARWTI